MSSYEIRRLAQELARQGRIVDDLATKPQLAYSSIEAGSVRSYDEEGNLRLVVGEQGDGTQSITVVDGPPPASPSRPSVAVDGPIITTVWDGELAGVEELPKDFQHIEVHVTPVPGDGTVLGVSTIEGRDGGQATVAVSQSGSYEVALVAVSQAGKRSVPSEAVTVEVTLVDIDGALKLVKESADGKNRLTWDPAQPPAQYEGAPGDTWFQTSDDGIVGQWRWTGAVWESQALTHEVIASIDLGKATVGELDGGRIEASTIGADQIAAGAIDGKIITGATVQTARSGRRVVMTEAGISAFDDSGAEQVRISAGESFFRGDLEADRLTSRGRAQFEGETTIAPNAVLRLSGGVQAPVSPPQLTPYWYQFEAPTDTPGTSNPIYAYGLASRGGSFFTFIGEDKTADHNRVIQFDIFGNLQNEFKTKGTFWAQGGLAAVGDRLYLLGRYEPPNYKFWVHVYTLDGKFVKEWEYKEVGWSKTNKLGYTPGIGSTDDGNLVIAHCYDTGQMMYRHYSVDGQLLEAYPAPDDDKTRSNIAGAVSGKYDRNTSAPACTIAKTSNNTMLSFDLSGSFLPGETFAAPPGGQVAGLCVGPGGKFFTISRQGRVTRHEKSSQGGGKWWASFAWLDNGASPNFRTDLSDPIAVPSWPARAGLRAIIPGGDIPDGAGSVALFMVKSESRPDRREMREYRQNYYLDSGVMTVEVGINPLSSFGAPLGEAALVNTFPQSGNSLLEASSKLFQVRSDGSGRWGSLTFTSTGEVQGLPKVPKVASGWVSVALPGNNAVGTTTVTLPAGLFGTAPNVALSGTTTDPRTQVYSVFEISNTSFQIKAARPGGGTAYINWVAVGE